MKRIIVSAIIVILFCATVHLLLAKAASAATKVDHEPLARIVGFPSFFKETGWVGLRLGSVALETNLRFGIGGTLAQVDMYGSGYLDPLAGSLWFQGCSGTAEMGIGIDAKAEYRFNITFHVFGKDYPYSYSDVLGEFNYGFFDREPITPYLLQSSVTLSDDLGPIPVYSRDFEIKLKLPWNPDYRLKADAGIKLSIDADNVVSGVELSTSRGTMTSEGERKSVSVTSPAFTVDNIVQTSSSAWKLGLTPKAVFSVELGVCCEFEIDIVTLPLSLPAYRFTTTPARSITFCTGTFYHDGDSDGYGDPSDPLIACSQPAHYLSAAGDCDDAVASMNPSLSDVAGNGIDDNCNGVIDETNTFYRDADGDGYGNAGNATQAPAQPAGYVANALDCDDALAAVHPGAAPLPGRDADCDGQVDEELQLLTFYRDYDGDGYGNSSVSVQASEQPDGYVRIADDCNDVRPLVNPDAAEICDDLDNDCDGQIDENVGFIYYADFDRDGFGNPARWITSCRRTLIFDPSNPTPLPQPMPIPIPDESGPLFAITVVPGDSDILTRYALNNRDCDDTDMMIHPKAREVCANSADDNCNGLIDEVCHPPTAASLAVSTDEDTERTILLSGADPDSDPLQFILVSGPSSGSLAGTDSELRYLPAQNYHGPDSIMYRVTDGRYESETATVAITVDAVNDPPVSAAGADQVLSVGATCEATATLDGAGCNDVDGNALAYSWSWLDRTAAGPAPQITLGAGSYVVGLVVNDGIENSLTDNMLITAVDQTLPVVSAPPDVTAECINRTGQQADIGTATVTDNCCAGEVVGSGPMLYPLGQSTVTWTAQDCYGNTGTASQTVTVQDTSVPALAVSVTPTTLWPPNHALVEVFPAASASDVCCGADVTLQLVTVTMSEGDVEDTFDPLYDVDASSGSIGDDVQVIDGRIYLRSERAGNSGGRTYTIMYRATDCAGNASLAGAVVTVPHDQR